MKFEILKKSHLKRNIMIGVVAVLIISAIILNFTRAKYRVTESIPLVNGTINYSLADLNIVALYIDGVEAEELDSNTTYTLDTTNSTCTYKDGTTIDNLTLSYDRVTGGLSISPYTTKGTKCTLYFDEYNPYVGRDYILSHYNTVLTRSNFSNTITNTTTGTIYKSLDSTQYDNDGEVYYFAGNPRDNWVYFGEFYWRIVRMNGDGSVRLIYNGTSTSATGTSTQLSETSTFNSSYNNNAYVGYMYTEGEIHGLSKNSDIKVVLDDWYKKNLLEYSEYIDGNTGFCGDRNIYSGTGLDSRPTDYAAYGRLISNKNPSLQCTTTNDLYTTNDSKKGNKALIYPIGLITADEVAYAGGVAGKSNQQYYLYTGQYYWTLSPFYFNVAMRIRDFSVFTDGNFGGDTNSNLGVRPVINIRADVTILGSGTASNPYTIS